MATPSTPSLWARLGSATFRHRWRVLITWAAVLLAVFASVGVVGSSSDGSFSIPDSESKRGFDTLEEHFGGLGAGRSGTIIFRADQGIDDPTVVVAMTALFDEVAEIDGVTLTSPYTSQGERAGQVATDGDLAGHVAFAQVDLADTLDEMATSEIGAEIVELLPTDVDGLQVEVGGQALAEFEPPESELIGLSFAIVVLILSFGSVLAMGLPIGVALFGVGAGAGLIMLLSNLMSVPDFATTLGAMIGLGVGIDYALFIVTRYREGLRSGMSPHDATVTAIDTAGRAVVFAGFTVVISLLGMFIMGLSFVNGLAAGAAITVLVTMVASVTLLPAFLGFAQHRVEVTRWRGIIAAALVAIALLGAGLGIQPLLVGAPLAVVVVLASFAVAPLRARRDERVEARLLQREHALVDREQQVVLGREVVVHRPLGDTRGGDDLLDARGRVPLRGEEVEGCPQDLVLDVRGAHGHILHRRHHIHRAAHPTDRTLAPPSTSSVWPVTQAASSDRRKAAGPATSSGTPSRRSG